MPFVCVWGGGTWAWAARMAWALWSATQLVFGKNPR